MRVHTRRLTVLALAATFVVAGCSTQATMSKAEVEKQISNGLEKQVGQKPDKVDCPSDIDAEIGKTMRCTLSVDDTTYGLTIKITSVDGDKANFDIKVDDKPEG